MVKMVDNEQMAFRDYGDFILAFDSRQQRHYVIRDIYSEFFRMSYEQHKDINEIIRTISSQYGVPLERVEEDFQRFSYQLSNLLSGNGGDGSEGETTVPTNNGLTDEVIYDVMTRALIPFSATIEITDACNEYCVHCYRGERKPSYWNIDTFESVLAQLRDMGCLHITLTGGEPLVHPEVLSFLELISDYGFVLTLQTNGTRLNEDVISLLAKQPVKDIAISLYSTVEEVHDFITGLKGSCSKTMSAIRALRERCIPVSVNMPVMTLNKDSVAAVRGFADSVGALSHFSFKIIPSQRDDSSTKALNCFSAELLADLMERDDVQLYQDIIPAIRGAKARARYCDACFRSLTIDAQGQVIICNAFRKNCGSVSTESLSSIWSNSTVINRWRSKVSLVNERCSSCSAYPYCEPCPAHEFTLTGDDSSIDEITCAFGRTFREADLLVASKGEEGQHEGVQGDAH